MQDRSVESNEHSIRVTTMKTKHRGIQREERVTKDNHANKPEFNKQGQPPNQLWSPTKIYLTQASF